MSKALEVKIVLNPRIKQALSKQNNKKLGEYKKLAHLIKALSNKKLALLLCLLFAEEHSKRISKEILIHHLINIEKNKKISINNIERRLKNAIN
jgi:hypothetical protein